MASALLYEPAGGTMRTVSPRLLVRHTEEGYELVEVTNNRLVVVERFARCEDALRRWDQMEERLTRT